MARPPTTTSTRSLPRITDDQRRARLAVRHHLAPGARARSPIEPARALIGYHATDPASVYLGAHARTRELDIAGVGEALYDERSLVRMLGMRRTMFVVPVDLVPVVQAAATNAIAAREQAVARRYVAMANVTDDPAGWLRDVADRTVEAVRRRGEAVATELARDVPELAIQIRVSEGKSYAATIGLSTRVLFLLSMEGRIMRARPRGSWISSQYRWTPTERWIPGGIEPLPEEPARAELLRRWLATFGPGTVDDLRWWTGWTLGETRRTLAALQPEQVVLGDGTEAVVLPGDLDTTEQPPPWPALLPSLDATVMGWKGRTWYLGEHGPRLFDRNGNAGPTVWWDGRVVGGWGQRPNAEIVVRLFEDLGREATEAIDAEANRVATFVAGQRITPRFRTPLEIEIDREG